jgi:hypothetical protein
MFEHEGSARISELLNKLRLVAGSPERTWTALTGSQGLRGLGPAFGTKLAYFLSYDRRANGNGPLIADRWTAWAFWALTDDWDIRRSAGIYQRYVETASAWAVTLSIGSPSVVRSDEVERALFVAGPYALQAWRELRLRR